MAKFHTIWVRCRGVGSSFLFRWSSSLICLCTLSPSTVLMAVFAMPCVTHIVSKSSGSVSSTSSPEAIPPLESEDGLSAIILCSSELTPVRGVRLAPLVSNRALSRGLPDILLLGAPELGLSLLVYPRDSGPKPSRSTCRGLRVLTCQLHLRVLRLPACRLHRYRWYMVSFPLQTSLVFRCCPFGALTLPSNKVFEFSCCITQHA